MGQAKQRGTYEERKAQAIERNAQSKYRDREDEPQTAAVNRRVSKRLAGHLAIAGMLGAMPSLRMGGRWA